MFEECLVERLSIRDWAVAQGSGNPLPMEELAYREAVSLLCHRGEPCPRLGRFGVAGRQALPAPVAPPAKRRRVTFDELVTIVEPSSQGSSTSSGSLSENSQDNG